MIGWSGRGRDPQRFPGPRSGHRDRDGASATAITGRAQATEANGFPTSTWTRKCRAHPPPTMMTATSSSRSPTLIGAHRSIGFADGDSSCMARMFRCVKYGDVDGMSGNAIGEGGRTLALPTSTVRRHSCFVGPKRVRRRGPSLHRPSAPAERDAAKSRPTPPPPPHCRRLACTHGPSPVRPPLAHRARKPREVLQSHVQPRTPPLNRRQAPERPARHRRPSAPAPAGSTPRRPGWRCDRLRCRSPG